MRAHLIRLFAALALLVAVSPIVGAAAPLDPAKPEQKESAVTANSAVLTKIEPLVLKELAAKGTTTYLIYMREQADLRTVQTQPDRLSSRAAIVQALQSTARRSQSAVTIYLDEQRASGHVKSATSFWIFNGLAVTGDKETLLALAARSDVERIQANHVHRLSDTQAAGPDDATTADDAASAPADQPATAGADSSVSPLAIEWNVSQVRAPEVWIGLGITGEGIVVATVDSGVYYRHPALLQKYRGYSNGIVDHNYNWFDATGTYPSAPDDGNGHGTHTMGTMVGSEPDGSNQIGVAPGAKWMAVKAFQDDGEGADADIHAAFQWVIAPTDLNGQNPDPSKAPDILSNSWGGTDGSELTFWQDVLALRAAGIMSVFASGNDGPDVGSVHMPGSYPQAFAVGASDSDDLVASFSGRGPSPWAEIKPEIVAPGVDIRSSVPPASGTYEGGWDGTSMATPHVAATTALLWQVVPTLSITATEFALTSTAMPLPSAATSPNNDYGWGRLDAFEAVSAIMNPGHFWGRVSDAASAAPVAGATITMQRQDSAGSVHTSTDSQGRWTFTVGAGIYQVTANSFWYLPQTRSDVVVSAGITTMLDFALTLRPAGTLSGHVTSGGLPITATITVANAPVAVETDASGAYALNLPVGTYDLRARPASGYRQGVASGLVVAAGGVTVQDFDLDAAPRLLLVDVDAWLSGASEVGYYQSDLDDLLYTYDLYKVISPTSSLPLTSTLATYDIVVWHNPLSSPGYLGAWSRLGAYLDQGGRLFISGQDIGNLDASYDSYAYEHYLHARYLGDDSGQRSLVGVDRDIFTGLSLTLNTGDSAGNQSLPDSIAPLDGWAHTVLSYTVGITTTGAGGLKIGTDTFQAIYLPFGLEGSGSRAARQETLERSLAWLSLPTLRKDVYPPSAEPGEVVTYTLQLVNTSGVQKSGLTISDPLPLVLSYVDGSATGGLAYDAAQRTLSWQGSITAQTTLAFSYQTRLEAAPGGRDVINTVYLQGPSGVPMPSSAWLGVDSGDFTTAHKMVAPSVSASGQEITYTIRLTNTGTRAEVASLVDPVPAGTTYVSGTAQGGFAYNSAANQMEWTGDVPRYVAGLSDYQYTTSDIPGGPVFSWLDISMQGTRIPAGDDTWDGPFTIGFPFTYFGSAYTTFWVSSNGWISFQEPGYSFYSNGYLPDPSYPRAMLAIWWDDLDASAGNIYYLASSDALVVSYVNVARFSSGGPYTFQVILHADGTFTYQYLDMRGSRLNEATIGLQDETGLKGLTVVYDNTFVHDQLAVRFQPRTTGEESKSFSFRVRIDDNLPLLTTLTNTAVISSSGVTYNLTATAIANTMDLVTSRKAVNRPVSGLGDTLVYTLTAHNTGTAAGTVHVTDVLPFALAYVPGSASNGATYDAATHSILWSGPVAPASLVDIIFAATVDPASADNTVITNTAAFVDPLGCTYERAAVTRYRVADLALSHKDVTPAAVLRPGDVATFTISVANGGGGETPFTVTDTLPAALVYVPGTLEAGHGVATYDAALQRITWSGNVPGLHQTYLRFAARVQAYGTVTNTAQIADASGGVIERSAAVSVSAPPRPNSVFLPVIFAD